MRAYFNEGLAIVVQNEEREKNKLTCIVNSHKKPRVFLRVVDKVTKNSMGEEPGFHIQNWPPNVNLTRSTKIFVYLSKERWHKLTTEHDPEADGGWFGSRCMYDRFSIHYYDFSKLT